MNVWGNDATVHTAKSWGGGLTDFSGWCFAEGMTRSLMLLWSHSGPPPRTPNLYFWASSSSVQAFLVFWGFCLNIVVFYCSEWSAACWLLSGTNAADTDFTENQVLYWFNESWPFWTLSCKSGLWPSLLSGSSAPASLRHCESRRW